MVTPHFSWAEVTRSATAGRLGISNDVPSELRLNVARTAQFMECIRSHLQDTPIRVTSWYRSPLLNATIGGSKTSVHPEALAVDWQPIGMPLELAFERVALSSLPFDQLIQEGTKSGARWIHVGLSYGVPRREVLKAWGDVLGGRMKFERVEMG